MSGETRYTGVLCSVTRNRPRRKTRAAASGAVTLASRGRKPLLCTPWYHLSNRSAGVGLNAYFKVLDSEIGSHRIGTSVPTPNGFFVFFCTDEMIVRARALAAPPTAVVTVAPPTPLHPSTLPHSSCTASVSGNQALELEAMPHTRQPFAPQRAAEPRPAGESGAAAARRRIASAAAALRGGSGAKRRLEHGDCPCSGDATAIGSTVTCQHTCRRRRPRRGAPPSRRCRPPPPQDAGSGSADAPAPSAALFCGAAAHDRRLPPLAAHENGRGGTCRCGPPGRRGLCRLSVERQSRQRQRRPPQLP